MSLGLILGAGVGGLPLTVVARSPTKTPYGVPSSPILTARIAGVRVTCLVRDGETHGIAPDEVNHRANIWALYAHGVRRCVAVDVVAAVAATAALVSGSGAGDAAVIDRLIDHGELARLARGGSAALSAAAAAAESAFAREIGMHYTVCAYVMGSAAAAGRAGTGAVAAEGAALAALGRALERLALSPEGGVS